MPVLTKVHMDREANTKSHLDVGSEEGPASETTLGLSAEEVCVIQGADTAGAADHGVRPGIQGC